MEKYFTFWVPPRKRLRFLELWQNGELVKLDGLSPASPIELRTQDKTGTIPLAVSMLYHRGALIREDIAREILLPANVIRFGADAFLWKESRPNLAEPLNVSYEIWAPTNVSGPLSLERAQWHFVERVNHERPTLRITNQHPTDLPPDTSLFAVTGKNGCLFNDGVREQLERAGLPTKWCIEYGTYPGLYGPWQLAKYDGGRRIYFEAVEQVRKQFGVAAATLWEQAWERADADV